MPVTTITPFPTVMFKMQVQDEILNSISTLEDLISKLPTGMALEKDGLRMARRVLKGLLRDKDLEKKLIKRSNKSRYQL